MVKIIMARFIEKVQEYSELYENGKKSKPNLKLWQTIAKECSLESAEDAQKIWQGLLDDYVLYLRNGGEFSYESEMEFMQEYLMGASLENPNEAELDLDENELQLLLESEDDDEEDDKQPEDKSVNVISSEPIEPSPKKSKIYDDHDDDEEEFNIKPPVFSPQKAAQMASPQKSQNGTNGENGSTNGFSNLTSLELIFLGYAKSLQKMPLPLQLKTKRKIANIIDEAELEMFEDQV